jgi:4-hydroxybenzoate polyprenyltransferase
MSLSSVAVTEHEGPARGQTDVPLVLDLDKTLLRTDLLQEQALAFVKENPLRVFLLVYWLLRGRAHLKRQLALLAEVDVHRLPVNDALAAYAEAEHAKGRLIVLATAADFLIASAVAQRFGFIARVIASNGKANLKGEAKAKVLAEAFPHGFAYAGDSRADLHVWTRATRAILVETSRGVTRRAQKLADVEASFPRRSSLRPVLKAARLHQWAKNTLVFVPLVLSGKMLEMDAWLSAGLAFLALGILASTTYLVNDLWDIEDDRRHWSKRNRPLASGRMSIKAAVIAVPAGLALSFLIGALSGPPSVVAVLFAYLALTLGYSFAFKRKPVLDAFVLAVLFTLRLVLGIVAVGAVASPWLLVFSMFLFASLSFAKRQTEVQRSLEQGKDIGQKIAGRGYFAADLPFILGMGIASGMASVLIMVLYLTDDALTAAFYGNSVWLWAIPPALFLWLSRIWMICQRGELHDDPVAFAIRDPKSLVICSFVGVAFVMAWAGVQV